MDYKGLIEQLKSIRFSYATDGVMRASVCEEAATAIETLLAERDAAINDIPKMCKYCVRFGNSIYEELCYSCLFNDKKSERGKSWQWRGPQKGGG